jgi:CRISPR-associated protein Cmr5
MGNNDKHRKSPNPSGHSSQTSNTNEVLPRSSRLLRDQRWALHAYNVVANVPDGNTERKDYKIAVNDLGTDILRCGLAAAVAALERRGERGKRLLNDLASSEISGLRGKNADELPGAVRGLDLDAYMLATREMLQVATWLKRAVQASFGDDA